jgi:hypothetical protein
MSGTSPTQNVWYHMLYRCNNPNAREYARYGGRGIAVEPRWQSFEVFVEDMGLKPAGLTLGRIDNNGGYNKGNCRWETYAQQGLNQGPRRDAAMGIGGVHWHKRLRRWHARGQIGKRRVYLYSGLDFLDACCARKSWEYHQKMRQYLESAHG